MKLYNLIYILCIIGLCNSEVITLMNDNHIVLRGEINEEMITRAIIDINKIEKDEIFVYINSNGGRIDSGNKFIEQIDYLSNNGKKISCVADTALSMAFAIFQKCNNRYITNASTLMQHQASLTISGNLNSINSYMAIVNDMDKNLNIMQANRIGVHEDKFREKIRDEWWIYGINNIDEKTADKSIIIGCEKDLFNKEIITTENQGLIEVINYYSGCPLAKNPIKTEIKQKIN